MPETKFRQRQLFDAGEQSQDAENMSDDDPVIVMPHLRRAQAVWIIVIPVYQSKVNDWTLAAY